MSDLLPCPFCGGEAMFVPQSPGYSGASVQCVECDCMGMSCRVFGDNDLAEAKAISAWNTRTPPQITDAMVDAAVLATLGRPYPSKQMMRAALTAALASTPVDTSRGGMG